MKITPIQNLLKYHSAVTNFVKRLWNNFSLSRLRIRAKDTSWIVQWVGAKMRLPRISWRNMWTKRLSRNICNSKMINRSPNLLTKSSAPILSVSTWLLRAQQQPRKSSALSAQKICASNALHLGIRGNHAKKLKKITIKIGRSPKVPRNALIAGSSLKRMKVANIWSALNASMSGVGFVEAYGLTKTITSQHYYVFGIAQAFHIHLTALKW